MNKYCLNKWDENNSVLRNAFVNNAELPHCQYDYIVKKVVKYILGNEWDESNITEINDGDYQGTLLYLIPRNTYQPDATEYLMTFVGYGSCSGCDTLQSIRSGNYDDVMNDDQINQIMALCKDIVTNMIKPYNRGWRQDDDFNEVEMQK